jgi:hypothetical protein
MRKVLIGVGIILILLGGLWLFQGLGILAGSVMTGQSFWAIVGTVLVIVGVTLCVLGMRRRPAPPAA